MSGMIDGSYDPPEGKKVFVSLRPGESSDEFATRAMGFLQAMSDGHVLDMVLASEPNDWETVLSAKWLDAQNRSRPKLRLRVTALSSSDGGSVGHLVVECEAQLVADDWGDLVDGQIYVPRAGNGRIRGWQSTLWTLVHDINGLGGQFEASFKRSGLTVE